MTEQDILDLIKNDNKMMEVLEIAEKLNLSDWLVGSGFVRNKIWNHLSGRHTDYLDVTDIDVVYFDPNGNDQKRDQELMEKLGIETGLEWEIRNNAYKYKSNERSEYATSEDVISAWPETVTAIGVRLTNGVLGLIAPYGIEDIVNFVVRPSPQYKDGVERIKERVAKKKWLDKWPQIQLELKG